MTKHLSQSKYNMPNSKMISKKKYSPFSTAVGLVVQNSQLIGTTKYCVQPIVPNVYESKMAASTVHSVVVPLVLLTHIKQMSANACIQKYKITII